MKRLTRVYDCETPKRIAVTKGKYPQTWSETTAVGKALLRLAAYEDTGLEPEEVTELMAAHGTAILELSEYRSIGPAKHFLELAQAEKGGRLVVLPFRDADYIYRVVDMQSHSAFNDFVSCERAVPFGIPLESSFGGVRIIPIEQFGKTVFLTREEAEAEMKKREEEDNEAD